MERESIACGLRLKGSDEASFPVNERSVAIEGDDVKIAF
jgi:hypothetical protein